MDIAIPGLIIIGIFAYILCSKMKTSSLYENRAKLIGFASVVAAVFFVTYVTITTRPVDIASNEHGEIIIEDKHRFFYGIMFDAGSTGSRIHVYQFQFVGKGIPYKLKSELFKQTKPGLSSYASFPKLGADSLRQMLNEAKNMIPHEQWGLTPIELKATAGLRLLGQKQSSAILDEVKATFRSYPFFMGNNSVGIMGGTDEGGLYDIDERTGTIDLGGGSVQLSFIPTTEDTLKSAPANYLKDIKVFSKNYKIYTHSYLGLGLMTARFEMMGGREDAQNPDILSSACFPAGFKGEYIHPSKKTYKVRGVESDSSFDSCYRSARKLVISYKIHQATEIKQIHFMLMSYFFDRAVDSNLISSSSDGELLYVKRYKEAAIQECGMAQRLSDFLCMDLAYITALLEVGFGFSPDTKVQVVKKIKNTEISWALGATFYMLNNENSPNAIAAAA